MQVSELEQETLDLDWFALDNEGAVGHFASGGCGTLPCSIVSSLEDLKIVTDFFGNRCTPCGSPVVSKEVDCYVLLKDEGARTRYLQDFIKMASRGLYSFDYLRSGNRPTGYFQVAKPSTSLYVSSLPQEIRQILGKTVLGEVCFRTADEIGAEVLR